MYDSSHVAPKTMLIFFGFLVFTAIYGSMLCALWVSHFAMRDVLVSGLPTVATLENKYIVEDTRYWFTYRFTTMTDETYLSSVKVPQAVYETYSLGMALPMRYLPDNPYLNALDSIEGEIRRDVWGNMRLSLFVIGMMGLLAYGWMRTIRRDRLRSLWQQLG